MRRKQPQNLVTALLDQPAIRRVGFEDRIYYSARDVTAALTESAHPDELWADLKRQEPRLADACERLELPAGSGELADVLDLEGVFRLAQAVTSPKAEKVKLWLAESGRQRVEELENPELALIRARKQYEREGYSRQWIDKRLRGISARQELTSEWARRGATESDQYRTLTNTLMSAAFGMDVEGYRRHKGLTQPSQNLRDHMSDMELVLTMLGETTAVALHRGHNSQGLSQLEADAADAGEITARTRREIERRGGRAAAEDGGNAGVADYADRPGKSDPDAKSNATSTPGVSTKA